MGNEKILGIDPGTNLLGFAVIEVDDDIVRILDIGTIKLDPKMDHQTKLKEIFLQLQEVIETYLPSVMAIEAPFFGKNVQSMLKLGRAQGVAMAAAMTMGLEIAEYSPKKIKQSRHRQRQCRQGAGGCYAGASHQNRCTQLRS